MLRAEKAAHLLITYFYFQRMTNLFPLSKPHFPSESSRRLLKTMVTNSMRYHDNLHQGMPTTLQNYPATVSILVFFAVLLQAAFAQDVLSNQIADPCYVGGKFRKMEPLKYAPISLSSHSQTHIHENIDLHLLGLLHLEISSPSHSQGCLLKEELPKLSNFTSLWRSGSPNTIVDMLLHASNLYILTTNCTLCIWDLRLTPLSTQQPRLLQLDCGQSAPSQLALHWQPGKSTPEVSSAGFSTFLVVPQSVLPDNSGQQSPNIGGRLFGTVVDLSRHTAWLAPGTHELRTQGQILQYRASLDNDTLSEATWIEVFVSQFHISSLFVLETGSYFADYEIGRQLSYVYYTPVHAGKLSQSTNLVLVVSGKVTSLFANSTHLLGLASGRLFQTIVKSSLCTAPRYIQISATNSDSQSFSLVKSPLSSLSQEIWFEVSGSELSILNSSLLPTISLECDLLSIPYKATLTAIISSCPGRQGQVCSLQTEINISAAPDTEASKLPVILLCAIFLIAIAALGWCTVYRKAFRLNLVPNGSTKSTPVVAPFHEDRMQRAKQLKHSDSLESKQPTNEKDFFLEVPRFAGLEMGEDALGGEQDFQPYQDFSP